MNKLVIMQDNKAVTTSLQIATVFGKQHRHVLDAIDEIRGGAENSADLYHEGIYVHEQNKQEYRMFYMNRDGFSLLAMGFTGKEALQFKLKYIDAFNQMESKMKMVIPTNPMEALKLMFDAHESSDKKISEHDGRLTELEVNATLSPGEYNSIGRKVSSKVNQVLFERRVQGNKKQKAELYKAINSDICKITGVRTRSNLRQRHFDLVFDFISNWEPAQAVMIVINQLEDRSE